MQKPWQKTHEKTLTAVRSFHRSEAHLVDCLHEAEHQKVYKHLGYTSLFFYAVSELGLSEANAYSFIAVSRKAREIPEMKRAIDSGHLSVSKAKKVVPVIQKENAGDWIAKAKTLPCRILEQAVAKECPKAATPERARYVSQDRLDLRLGVSEKLLNKIKRVQDILSQKERRAVSMEEAMDRCFDLFLEKKDPEVKAKRVINRRAEHGKIEIGHVTKMGKINKKPFDKAGKIRKPIPMRVKHEVMRRDGGQCTHVLANGERCGSRRWLDLHHVRRVSRGGEDSVNNLQLLCSAHHRMVHGG